MKPLRFIHISKTGGQSIAQVAKYQANICWGFFDKEYGKELKCHRIFSSLPTDIKNKYDWFTVVRNPYHRAVSHYNWDNTTMEINEYIQYKLTRVEAGVMDEGAHFTQQYKYLEDGYDIIILHYENLEQDFNNLMIKYNYNIVLDKHFNKSRKHVGLHNLTLKTIEMINKVYEKDFTTFGYEMVHSVFT